MIGLVLVTHGRLAEELRLAMEHVVGPQRNVATICIGADDDVECRRADILHCIEQVDTGDGVVIMTDMFGGTPSNLAISMMSRRQVEVIAGVNLPMLVKFAKSRSRETLGECVETTETAGRKYIAAASHVLSGCRTTNRCEQTARQAGLQAGPMSPVASLEAIRRALGGQTPGPAEAPGAHAFGQSSVQAGLQGGRPVVAALAAPAPAAPPADVEQGHAKRHKQA